MWVFQSLNKNAIGVEQSKLLTLNLTDKETWMFTSSTLKHGKQAVKNSTMMHMRQNIFPIYPY